MPDSWFCGSFAVIDGLEREQFGADMSGKRASRPYPVEPMLPWVVRLLRLVLMAMLLSAPWCATPALAAEPARLLLDEQTPRLEAWDVVTFWQETGAPVTVEQALRHLGEFRTPTTPAANLGVRPVAVWLRIPVQVPEYGSGRWIFDVDYPALDLLDLYVVTEDGYVSSHARAGDHLPMSQHPMRSRAPAVRLHLEPGRAYDLMLRVDTNSTMVLPITLAREDEYHVSEARREAGQGLLAGVSLCLLVYSLIQWLGVREAAFGWYGLNVFGVGFFFLSQSGLGPQHLWGESVWMTDKISPLSILLALVGGMMFIDRVLLVRELWPRVSQMLRGCSAVTLVTSVLFTLDLLSYQVAGLVATLLGPVPMLLGMPVAWVRSRHGDRAARYIFAGWGLYSVGVVVMALLLRGLVHADFWTQHAMQFAAMCEMAMWMMVLGVRTDEIRHAAEQAHRERDRMTWLAHTDPLTGALNRRGLQGALQPLLETASLQQPQAIYLLDLDGFKPVNDQHGHEVGDALLIEVVRRLRAVLRQQDLVARTGGDEFVIVAGLAQANQAESVGNKLMQAFSEEFGVQGCVCRVGATVGYVLVPADGRDPDTLLRRADAAMYAGKQAGRHQLRRASPEALATA